MIFSKSSITNIKKSPYDIKCSIGYSAPLEQFFCLSALLEPDLHKDCCTWARKKFSSLSTELKKEIIFFSSHYAKWIFITDIIEYLTIGIDDPEGTPEKVAEDIKNMDSVDFAYIFLGFSAFGYDKSLIRKWQEDPETVTYEALGTQQSFFKIEDVKYFFKNIDDIKERLSWVITRYWYESFSKDWHIFESYLNSQINKEKSIISETGPIQYISKLHTKVFLKDGVLIFSKNPDFSINVKDIKEINITLSLFIGDENLAVNIIDNNLYITKNLGFQAQLASQPVPEYLLNTAKALGDETRLTILKILNNGQSTTQELSKIIHLSASAVSLHLKQLKKAGLVDCYKENKFVYYYINSYNFSKIQNLLEKYIDI